MISYFDLPDSLSYDQVAEEVMSLESEEERLDFLSELASHAYSDPDKCDKWACNILTQIERDYK